MNQLSPIPASSVSMRTMIPAPARLGCAALLLALNGFAMETSIESLDLRETQQANWHVPKAGLAFGDSPLLDAAKIAILGASTVAGLIGFVILRQSPAVTAEPGVPDEGQRNGAERSTDDGARAVGS